MTKEALKLALEALEDHGHAWPQIHHESRYAQAMISVREALAQPEQEPAKYDCCANCLRPQHEHNENACPKPYTTVWHSWDYDFSPYPVPAVKHLQPEQELCPSCRTSIIYACTCTFKKASAQPTSGDYALGYSIGFGEGHEAGKATPPQRKPLTPSQVQKIWKESGYDEALMEERAHFINGIRHAEVAHGIKE